jgi:uncharacterized protein (TIGR02466 family)
MKEIEIKFSEATRHTLFPTLVYAFQLENPDILDEYAQKLRDMQSAGEGITYTENNWCSLDNLNLRKDWDLISGIALDRTNTALKDIGIKFDGLRINCMWSNIHKTGSSHQLHNHPNCMYSGVIYLNVPEGTVKNPGYFYFKDPVRQAYQIVYDGHQHEQYMFRPRKGFMLIFPSWLEHGIDLCNFPEDQDRISLSFNIMVETTITSHTVKADYR